MALRVSPHRPSPRIACEVLLAGLVQSDLRSEAQQLGPTAPEDIEPRGLALEPVLRDRRRLCSLVPLDHRHDGLHLAAVQPVRVHLSEARPVPQRRCRRVRPMQENEIRERALVLATLASRDPLSHVSPHPRVHVPICGRIAPAQVRVDHLSREVVRKHAVRPGLHERQTAQPGEQLRPLAISKDAAQEPRRRQPRVGRAFERHPMARTRHPGQKALHQPRHHVGRRAQLQRPHIHIRFRLPLREHVHQQRQCERVAVRELEHPTLLLLRDTRAAQEGPRVVRPEVAQGHHTQQVAPPWIPTPRRPGSVSARYHNQRTCRQWRDEPLPQPVLEPDRSLEGVQQQHRTLVAGKRLLRRRLCRQPERAPKLRHERWWRRLDRAKIERHDAHAGVRGRLRKRAQQRGLANPAGTMDPQHAERRFRRSQRPQEQLELRGASHEPPPPRALQAVSHRQRGRRLVRVLPRDRGH